MNEGEAAVADRVARQPGDHRALARSRTLRRNPTPCATRGRACRQNVDQRPLPYAERAPLQQRAASVCRSCRRRRSAPSRRRPNSAPLAGASRTASSMRPSTSVHRRTDRERGRRAGRARSRRAGARRARAQRHGPVLRRAAGGLRLHPQRLGAELRLALCPPADHLRRRLTHRSR